jgi:TRAP transporter TAXI family solute receptor
MAQRFFQPVIILGLILIIFASCSQTDAPQQQGEPTVDVNGTAVPERIKMATASVGGSYYPIGNALAQTLTKNLPGVLVTAENSSGSAQNIRMMDAGQVHFGLSNAAITYPAVRGLEGFEKPFPMKVVISLNASINLMVALKNNGITTWADLKGKRIVIGPAGAGWDFFARARVRRAGSSHGNADGRHRGRRFRWRKHSSRDNSVRDRFARTAIPGV